MATSDQPAGAFIAHLLLLNFARSIEGNPVDSDAWAELQRIARLLAEFIESLSIKGLNDLAAVAIHSE